MTGQAASDTNDWTRVLADYETQPGVADELFDTTGAMRPVWRPLIESLAGLDREIIEEHFARGANYLRDAGVYFRQYSSTPSPERDWPLSPIPVLIHETEWSEICAGLAQRADLLEMVMADLYGPGRLVAEGHLPAELVARNPGWMRPMVGIPPASGNYLHMLSFELSRNPDGSWFVLGDRTQAPSGAGFALENRIATSRVFSELYPRSNVRKLAVFFRQFRKALDALTGTKTHRSAILSPGPNNASYFEHTYIARYLGLLLLEGEDMIVRDGEVMVRTVEGPQPLGTIWRRVDSEYMDPLELREDSQLGTPGLVNALRQGSVNMVNAVGSGVLEMRAMMAFLPKISEVMTDAPLELPNIATWWCGQPSERAYVKANAKSLMIGGALDLDLPFDIGATTAVGGRLRAGDPAGMEDWIDREAGSLVGQELVTLSTAPAYIDGKLVPRPMTVRITAARTPDGWIFMPGGYARFGTSGDSTALAMQRGGSVSDVWIVGDAPETVGPSLVDGGLHRVDPEPLPSRAAENMFWLGRYVERAETAVRLVRAFHLRLAETGDPSDPRLTTLLDFMGGVGLDPEKTIPDGLLNMLAAASSCAGKVRDRFSTDGWSALQDLSKTADQMTRTAVPGDDCARAMSVLLRKLSGFSGLVHENMYRFPGWRFLALGRAIERCDSLAMIFATFADPAAPQGSSDIAIELADSAMTHRRRYRGDATPQTVIDLLACDALNPRSILYQLNQMVDLASELPITEPGERLSRVSRMLLPLQSRFAVLDPALTDPLSVVDLRGDLSVMSDLISSEYLR